jgi:deazaflavin-dependent oxidoreductase (nitroreductase family)
MRAITGGPVAFIASIVPEQLKWISDRYSAVMSKKDHPNNAPGVPMVFPVWFENLQVKYLNSALKPIARYLPGTGTIEHRGRKSGKSYKTIVTAYRKGNVLAIALAHGKTDWVKNVLAAGQADLRFARREVHLTNPRILPAGYDGPDVPGLPWLAKAQLRRMAVFVSDIA